VVRVGLCTHPKKNTDSSEELSAIIEELFKPIGSVENNL
jgi:hypothetical protein